MTAVVGILNKHGVAIAADSAVTHVRFSRKTTKNGNKMIRISNCVPICVMVTGRSEFNKTLWDIIIRHYRLHRGDIPHQTVEACAHDFFRYISDNHLFWEKDVVDRWIKCVLNELFEEANDNVEDQFKERDGEDKLIYPEKYRESFLKVLRRFRNDWLKTGACEQFKDYSQAQFHEYIGDLVRSFLHMKTMDPAFDSFPIDLLNSLENDLELTLMVKLTTHKYLEKKGSTLVFTGFGSSQEYPSLVQADVLEGFDNRVNYYLFPENIICISDENPVAICPFAQKDIIISLLHGLHAGYARSVVSEIQAIYKTPFSSIFNIGDDDKEFENLRISDFLKMLQDVKTDDLDKKTSNALFPYLDKKRRKWEKEVENYDLLAMAALAQSLIDLTAFHRILTFVEESVGGPVDLAVITKSEGFTWLSRKSWYHHKDVGGKYGALGV